MRFPKMIKAKNCHSQVSPPRWFIIRKTALISVISLFLYFSGCEPINEPPTATLEVTPLNAVVPAEIRMKVTGEDPNGIEDLTEYMLIIGNETVRSKSPIDVTRTFYNIGTLKIYGQVTDSENQTNKTEAKTLELVMSPFIEQSASLINENEISYSATVHKKANTQLTIKRDGTVFLTLPIPDVYSSGVDYQKTFKFSPDGITKGNYEFELKADDLKKNNSVEVPNYKPTTDLSGVDAELMEGVEKTITLPIPSDKNPEDNPVTIQSAKSLDNKTQVTLNGNSLKIKPLVYSGPYQVEIEFGNTVGGLEKAILKGNINELQEPYIDQSLSLINDSEIAYSATVFKKSSAHLEIRKDGNDFLTLSVPDITSTGVDFQKTFKFSPDGITKGIYEFKLKSDDLEKNNSIQVPNYNPTIDLSGLEAELNEGVEKTIILPTPLDRNPEDNPVSINRAESLDGKTQVTLNGNSLIIMPLTYTGDYQVEIEFGSISGGIETAILKGNIIEDTRMVFNPFIQPNDSTLNWYGSGDVNNDNHLSSLDITRITELIDGAYSNPADTRLYDRADVNGDGVVNSNDRQILENRVNGSLSYMPGEWNKLTSKVERVNWLTKVLSIDKTDEMRYIIDVWMCGDFSWQTVINFHGIDVFGSDNSYDWTDNGRFNLPVYNVFIGPDEGLAHNINLVYTGDDLYEFTDGTYIEPQTDEIVYPGSSSIPQNCKVTPRIIRAGNMYSFLTFRISNSIPSLSWENPYLNIINHR